MPSPYELKTRWLEWHERWPVPEIESLKRQIDTIKREIADRESVRDSVERYCPEEYKAKLLEIYERHLPSVADLNEVLATLERLMPPF